MIITLSDIQNMYAKDEIMVLNNNQPKNILFIGSCRIHAFLNYFINDDFFGTKYNYLCILVHVDKMVTLSKTCIHNENFKQLLSNSTILVSEYLKNFNYFNSSDNSELNIWQMNPNFENTIFLPNYDNPRIYVKDILFYDPNMKSVFQNYLSNKISLDDFSSIIKQVHENELNRFYLIIKKSIMPELEIFVRDNIYKKRIAHTINHPSNILFIEMYRLLLKNIFGHTIPESVVILNNAYEFLKSDGYSTKLTYYDKLCLIIQYDEPIYNEEKSNKYLLCNENFFKDDE